MMSSLDTPEGRAALRAHVPGQSPHKKPEPGYAPARLLPADAAAESARRRRCVAGDSGSCDVE